MFGIATSLGSRLDHWMIKEPVDDDDLRERCKVSRRPPSSMRRTDPVLYALILMKMRGDASSAYVRQIYLTDQRLYVRVCMHGGDEGSITKHQIKFNELNRNTIPDLLLRDISDNFMLFMTLLDVFDLDKIAFKGKVRSEEVLVSGPLRWKLEHHVDSDGWYIGIVLNSHWPLIIMTRSLHTVMYTFHVQNQRIPSEDRVKLLEQEVVARTPLVIARANALTLGCGDTFVRNNPIPFDLSFSGSWEDVAVSNEPTTTKNVRPSFLQMNDEIKCAHCRSVTVRRKNRKQKKKPKTSNMNHFKKCAGCRRVWYCDRECQKLAWREHKIFCHRYQARAQHLIFAPKVSVYL
jgi:hypothetical protein